jgi:hypothetical protein
MQEGDELSSLSLLAPSRKGFWLWSLRFQDRIDSGEQPTHDFLNFGARTLFRRL